ncbi:MAG: 2-amino-4-hydroxy-6-hydroxymethyldihydropteridine diphosphokinase [Lachnospiraceae bacterium]|nr:2-amino-4-hydroxy-6-hydroxymethyldihydropteridine diphosphokinase [Lachnospiraceae bacterium]
MPENRNYDVIRIEELEIYANHGVFAEETKLGQKFFVNAALYTQTRCAGRADDLALSTNYGEVCMEISRFLTEHTYRLLEAAAERLAERLLLTFPKIHELELEIRKPSAPIPLPFQSVSVVVRRGWKRAVIACGANLGEKERTIREAVDKIRQDEKCRVLRESALIVTKPYGGVAQDDFVNGAFLIETLYDAEELLCFLNRLEAEAGRQRLVHWGPRTLDLDIIFYEDEIIRTEKLTVPHADMQNRDFVLEPLAEIAPEWMHPVFHKTAAELLERLES